MASKRQRLAGRRKAVGHSQEQLAERLGVERSTVARWESGETGPQPWLRPKLARALQVSIEQLDGLLAEAGSTDDLSDERLTYAVEHPSSVDLVTVARLHQQVEDLDLRYDRVPSTTLLAGAGQCLGQVSFLREHAPTNRVRREHATARTYFDQAIAAARQLPNPAAEGLATLRKCFVALYGEKDPKIGLSLAMQTADVTRNTSHVLTGLAVLHAAEAYAMLGEQQNCEEALSQAEAHFARIATADPAIDLFSSTQHDRLAGSCYLFLKNAKRAEHVLEATARALQDRSKSQAIVLGNLTLAYIRQTKLDEAAVTLHRTIDVVEQTWGGGGLNIVFNASRELRQWRQVPVVQDVYDRLLSIMARA